MWGGWRVVRKRGMMDLVGKVRRFGKSRKVAKGIGINSLKLQSPVSNSVKSAETTHSEMVLVLEISNRQ